MISDAVGRRDVKKITVNNRMRNALRTDIATLTLASPEPKVRLSAALEMVGTDDADTITALRAQLEREDAANVRDAIILALAIADLKSEDPTTRLAGVESLRGSLYPEARNALVDLMGAEQDAAVVTAAEEVLAEIEGKLELNRMAETLFFGLSLGSVLVLAAIGLAITFGVMGIINMAHGELIMIGAYTTYLVQLAMPNAIDYSLFVAIPAAFIVSGLFGIAIERTVIRFLYGRPLETLLATFGISLILQQLVRTAISAQNVIVENPSWMSGSLTINPALTLTFNRIFVLIFALMVFVALLLILKRTALGLAGARGVAESRHGAGHGRALGAGGCDDLRPRRRHRRGCRRGLVAAHQRRPQHGAGLYHRLLHGRRVRRRRQSLGHAGRRADARCGEQVHGALDRGGAGQDPGAGVHHPVHPETPAGAVPAARPCGGGLTR